MPDNIRWGIIGTGNIARKMAQAIKNLPNDAVLMGVASRTNQGANAFGEEFDVPKQFAGYHKLAHDEEIDIIYVATPHPMHIEDSMMCLHHGKAVICEKPLTINAQEAGELINFAREQKVFLMEAMWTRFLPAIQKMKELVDGGAIGEVRMLQADFGFRAGWDPTSRLLNLELAGGGLLDVGVYTVSLAHWILGKPEQIASLAHIGQTGVDEQNGAVMLHNGGRISLLSSAVRTSTPHLAHIIGTDGMIQIPHFWCANEITVTAGGNSEHISLPYTGNGFEHEAMECIKCLHEGKTESDIMPLDDSLAIQKTMDTMRAQWGLKYPGE